MLLLYGLSSFLDTELGKGNHVDLEGDPPLALSKSADDMFGLSCEWL